MKVNAAPVSTGKMPQDSKLVNRVVILEVKLTSSTSIHCSISAWACRALQWVVAFHKGHRNLA